MGEVKIMSIESNINALYSDNVQEETTSNVSDNDVVLQRLLGIEKRLATLESSITNTTEREPNTSVSDKPTESTNTETSTESEE